MIFNPDLSVFYYGASPITLTSYRLNQSSDHTASSDHILTYLWRSPIATASHIAIMQASEGRRKMEALLEGGRPVKHVSRKALYTRLEARITYLKDFLDFNSSKPSPLAKVKSAWSKLIGA